MATNKKPAAMQPTAAPKTVSLDRYVRILEDYHRVTSQNDQLREQFQQEYAYAEEQMRLVETMTAFIEADKERSKRYKEYLKSIKDNG